MSSFGSNYFFIILPFLARTIKCQTTSATTAAPDMGWLIYMMIGIFALIGIVLVSLIGFVIYTKFFKFKKPIGVAERIDSSEPKPTAVDIRNGVNDDEEQKNKENDKTVLTYDRISKQKTTSATSMRENLFAISPIPFYTESRINFK